MKKELDSRFVVAIVAVVAIAAVGLGFTWFSNSTAGERRDVQWEEERAKQAEAFVNQYGGAKPQGSGVEAGTTGEGGYVGHSPEAAARAQYPNGTGK